MRRPDVGAISVDRDATIVSVALAAACILVFLSARTKPTAGRCAARSARSRRAA
jgi:hypothetical protein